MITMSDSLPFLNSRKYVEDLKLISEQIKEWDRLRNKKILVVGASGLVGGFFVDLIMFRNVKHHDNISIRAIVRNVDRAKIRFQTYLSNKNFFIEQKDIALEKPANNKVDYVINAASNTHPILYSSDPIGTITTNIFGTSHLLEYCVEQKVERFILLSSVEIYGENRGDTTLFREDYLGYIDSNTLRSGYPESKRLAESLCNAYQKKHNLDFVIARLSRIYGPNNFENDSKVMSQFIRNTVNNSDITLKSAGNQLFSYIYVADAVKAIILLLVKGKAGEAYNVGNESKSRSLKEIADFLASINGKKVIFDIPKIDEKQGYSTATKAMLDITKIKTLDWTENYDVLGGLRRTIDIIKEIKEEQY